MERELQIIGDILRGSLQALAKDQQQDPQKFDYSYGQ